MESLQFLREEEVRQVAAEYGTPVYVYDAARLKAAAERALAFPAPKGLTVRYAMKALPTGAVLKLFTGMGLHIDASSGFEVERALRAGVPPECIQLTAQQLPDNFVDLVSRGVRFCACSLRQLEAYGAAFPDRDVVVRINPGLGSGHSNRTNTGGVGSSFGIWRGLLDEVKAAAERHGLTITTMHTHIGSGSDPDTWVHCARLSLELLAQLPEVTTLSLGGGYKVGRMLGEASADLHEIGARVQPEFEQFAREQGRTLDLEIEPGTYLTATAGALVAEVHDLVDTGPTGYHFLKTNTGMTEILRPSLYGAQHPIVVVPRTAEPREAGHYLVVGHCCESGDLLTPKPGDPEALEPRTMAEAAVGDFVVIEAVGAYCSSMSAKNYNAFPEVAEVMRTAPGTFEVIRRAQSLDQVLANEVV